MHAAVGESPRPIQFPTISNVCGLRDPLGTLHVASKKQLHIVPTHLCGNMYLQCRIENRTPTVNRSVTSQIIRRLCIRGIRLFSHFHTTVRATCTTIENHGMTVRSRARLINIDDDEGIFQRPRRVPFSNSPRESLN